MKRAHFLLTAGYGLLFCVSLSFSILQIGNTWYAAGWPPMALFVCVVGFSVPTQFCSPRICACIFAAIALAAGLVCLVLVAGDHPLTAYIQAVQVLGASCAAVCAVAITQNNLWLKSALVLSAFAAMVVLSLYRVSLQRTAIYALLLCVAVVLTQWAARKNNSAGQASAGYLFYVFAVLLSPLLLLPTQKAPMQWAAVKQALQAVSDAASSVMLDVTTFFSSSAEATMGIGLGENGLLGGNIGGTGHVALTLSGNRTRGPLYISSAAYDTYTGQSWLCTQADTSEEYRAQYERVLAALEHSRYTQSEIDQLLHLCNYTVEYKYMKTKNVFLAPVTSLLVWEGNEPLEQNGDRPILQKPQKTGFHYKMYFTEIDWQGEAMQELLRGNAWESEPLQTPEEQQRQAYVTRTYLNLPQAFSPEITQLAQQLTAGCENDYDKLKAIQTYVRQYTYTKTPGTAPKDADFAAYFLLESKQGYCTHFATAMTILARCAGIPARYVTGFVAGDTANQENNPVLVREQQAHAWVEAYIPPIGWVPFDPSPSSATGAISIPWIQPGLGESLPAQAEVPILSIQGAGQPASSSAQNTDGIQWANLMQALLYGAKCAIAFLCAVVCAAGLRAGIRALLYQKKTDPCKVEYLMRYILAFGKRYGCKRQASDTLEAYAAQLNGRMDTPEISFSQLCALYQQARFGTNSMLPVCVGTMEAYTKALRKQYKAQRGPLQKLLFLLQ